MTLYEIFEPKEIIVKGRVISGFGKGKYYIGLDEYKKRIKDKLGFEPYSGTLNIKLNSENKDLKKILKEMSGMEIDGFEKEGKPFGSIKCFNCEINNIRASIIIPEKSQYDWSVLEIISAYELRKELDLKNESEVIITYERKNDKD